MRRYGCALRSFLRYGHLAGLVETDLSAAVLPVSGRRRSLLPQGIIRAQARALLGGCDRRRAIGRRDYAVIVLMLRLGLRAGEVAALRLEDIDWRAGQVTVHGKGGTRGSAAAAGRCRRRRSPGTCSAAARAPPRGRYSCVAARRRSGLSRSAVSTIVRRACAPGRAWRRSVPTGCGTPPPARCCAPAGPLAEIGQVLRHRSLGRHGCLCPGGCRTAADDRAALADRGAVMSALAEQLDDYLRLRRALGFKLGGHASACCPSFVAYLDGRGATTVTVELALAWAPAAGSGSSRSPPSFRLSAVRGFARYLHAIDPAHEVPPPGLLAVPRRRPAPYLYSPAEIAEVLATTRRLRPPLRAATYRPCSGCWPRPACGSGRRWR